MAQRGMLRKRGATWTAYWWVDAADGSQQRSKGGFATKNEAQTYLNETLQALQRGQHAEPTKVRVGEYLTQRWLPSRKASIKPSTYDSYRRTLELHVVPAIGQLKLQNLRPDHLDTLYADLLESGLAPKSVRNIHTMLHKALKDAMRKNLVVRNVAEVADPPRAKADHNLQTWTGAQLRKFLTSMAEHRLHAAFLLGATTGMRRGEVLGLRWSNVDLRRRRIKVVETVLNIGYEITEGTPKTARGRRTVAIDAATVEALREHRRKQEAERAAAGSDWTDLDLVFTRPDGTFVHPDIYSQTFRRAVRRLGLPYIRLHDLRHTHATLGLEAGIPVKVMSTRLGHATTAFTQDVYMHSVPSLEDSAADQIADLIFGDDDADEPPQD